MSRHNMGDRITRREHDVLAQLRLGRTNKEIAQELGLGVSTVEKHIAHMMLKTNTDNRTQLSHYQGPHPLEGA
jgi:DNA-binding NarL/FixJ family response regulator